MTRIALPSSGANSRTISSGTSSPRESVDEVVLVASELVGNAVRHTVAKDDLGLDVDWTIEAQGVTVRVCDPSPVPPSRARRAQRTRAAAGCTSSSC